MKLNNLTSLDPAETARGIKGLSGASKLDRQIWDEYQSNRFELVMEIEETLERHATNQPSPTKETDVQSVVNTRRGQNFFRRTVLASYSNRCCITGNCVPEMLRASHILPWSTSKDHRLDPSNGLCLTADFDAAFDRGLITFDDDYRLILSPRIKEHGDNQHIQTTFISREHQPLQEPEKNLPSADRLQHHRETIFQQG